MATSSSIQTFLVLISALSHLTSTIGLCPFSGPLSSPSEFRQDPGDIEMASTDFGSLAQLPKPKGVLYPSSVHEIVGLVKFSNIRTCPYGIAARGNGHSLLGQAMAPSGVVVDMRSLSQSTMIMVGRNPTLGAYADVGGGHLWIEVLEATLKYGLAPVSWTDYLYLTVGGTLSNAGISGQTFRHGPQISNVYELDVVTGRGDIVTCSQSQNPELFYGVLGGLGQFGIITRARIHLDLAPSGVVHVQMIYDDFQAFSRDQERLILADEMNYLEGFVLLQNSPNTWTSLFSPSVVSKISALRAPVLYCIEAVKYYFELYTPAVAEEFQELVTKSSGFIPGFFFTSNIPILDFLNRVHFAELSLREKGLWDVPHPWLNLFVPKSRIGDFDDDVFKRILPKIANQTTGPFIVYPMLRNKWDDRMSAVVPEEDIFYTVGLLHSNRADNWGPLEDQNIEILKFCENAGIKVKLYLSRFTTKGQWMDHFGPKWTTFAQRKAQFDPRMILSPGQLIFS